MYYHDLFLKLDGCKISVSRTQDGGLSSNSRQFGSLMLAVEFIEQSLWEIDSITVTAHQTNGPVRVEKEELSELIKLTKEIRVSQS